MSKVKYAPIRDSQTPSAAEWTVTLNVTADELAVLNEYRRHRDHGTKKKGRPANTGKWTPARHVQLITEYASLRMAGFTKGQALIDLAALHHVCDADEIDKQLTNARNRVRDGELEETSFAEWGRWALKGRSKPPNK